MAAIKFWRMKCNFDAYGGKVHVEERLLIEQAESEKEAKERATSYLLSMDYTNPVITAIHVETEREKYDRSCNGWEEEDVADSSEEKANVPSLQLAESSERVKLETALPAVERFSDDLF